MASAYQVAAPAPGNPVPNDRRGLRGRRRIRSEWLVCTPDTPWGVHGRIVDQGCARCGWTR